MDIIEMSLGREEVKVFANLKADSVTLFVLCVGFRSLKALNS